MMNLRCIVLGATVFALLLFVAVPVAGDDASTADETHDKTEVQPVTEDPIKRVHVLNPGEREYLSPNLIGVQNIAMTYLPLTMNFINIIDAFREIVDGVRYEILLNAVDTKDNDADIVCRLVILEKPWLRSEWGDKVRELQHSNCTSDADNLTDPLAKMRALSDKYESNALFNGGTRNELSADEMAQLESQIMTSKSEGGRKTSSSTTSTSTTTTSTTTTTESSVLAAVKDDVEDTDTVTPVAELITSHLDIVHGDNNDELSTAEPKELSDDEKKWLDDIFSIGSLSFENSRQSEGQQHNNKKNHDDDDNEENDTSAKSNYLKRTIQTDAEPEVEQVTVRAAKEMKTN